MIPQQNRLTKVRDFNLIMKHGRYLRGTFVDLKWLKLADIRNYFPKKEDSDKFESQLKIAFSVGIKVSKSAVKRNRVKRQMREIIRLILKENKLQSGYYLLFLPRPIILYKDYAEINNEMILLLSRTKILVK